MRGHSCCLVVVVVALQLAALVAGQQPLTTPAPSTSATEGSAANSDFEAWFMQVGDLDRFEGAIAVTVLARNDTLHLLTFRFNDPSSPAAHALIEMSPAERESRYGITRFREVPRATVAPTPPATITAAPDLDPALPHYKFELFFLPTTTVVRSNVIVAVAAVLGVPTWRLEFSDRYLVRIPARDAATGNTYYVDRQLIYFRVTNPPPGPAPPNDPQGNYTSILVVNTRALADQARLVAALPGAVGFNAIPNDVPLTFAQVVSEGSQKYSDEKLAFMGGLIATFVVTAVALILGWVRTQQLAAADLAARIAAAQQAHVQKVMEGASSPSPLRAASPSSLQQQQQSSASPPGPNTSAAGAAASPMPGTPSNRPRRSVSFHQSAVKEL